MNDDALRVAARRMPPQRQERIVAQFRALMEATGGDITRESDRRLMVMAQALIDDGVEGDPDLVPTLLPKQHHGPERELRRAGTFIVTYPNKRCDACGRRKPLGTYMKRSQHKGQPHDTCYPSCA